MFRASLFRSKNMQGDMGMHEITEKEILSIVHGWRKSRALLTATELGVWAALDNGPKDAPDIAEAIAADVRATDRLLHALCAMGLLRKENKLFSHTSASSRWLSPASEEYFGNLGHHSNLWERWSLLTDAVRAGTAPDPQPLRFHDRKWLENFIAAMHHRASIQAPADVNLIDFHDASSVLDIGGGSGAHAVAMARVRQDLRITVFDLPEVLPITRRYIDDAGCSSRIQTIAGDYLVDDFGAGYDIVFLSMIIHSHPPEENLLLLRRCASALNPGGRLVIQDFVLDEDRAHPEHAVLFALNMLVATSAGDSYTESEIREWLLAAGLGDIERRETAYGATQISAVMAADVG
jgi:predicted O-methyltransferase YrrM